ncbi:MAG: SusF/SusE family outer membrane protein [Bacteroidales bacterium]
MKKLSLYTLSLLLFGLSACVEDSELPAPPQGWEHEDAKAGVSFTSAAVAPIELAKVSADSMLAVCTYTDPVVAEAVFTHEVRLDGKLTITLDPQGKLTKEELQRAVVELYGKRPEERTIKTVITAFADIKGQVTRFSAPEINLTVTPEAPYIEPGYYLVGNMCGWSADDAIAFQHSGKDVYEDPIFTLIVKTTGNNYWKIIPKSLIDKNTIDGDGVLGVEVDGSTDATGTLITVNPQAGKIEDPGYVKITLNMMEYTYSIEPFTGSPYLYVVGNHQKPEGWKPEHAGYVYSTDMKSYQGFFSLDGEFKFTSEKSWNGTNYGNGGDQTLSTDGGAGNMSVPAGFYLLKASLDKMTWSAEPIETFGLIGDATEGSWDASTKMTFDAETSSYSITTTLKSGKQFKFRANNGWDINLGGDLNNLTFGGDNIPVTQDGTYVITLNLKDAAQYTCTLVKK